MARVRKNIDRDDAKIWKVKIPLTLSGYQRRLIASYFGEPGMAKLQTCRQFILSNGMGALDDLDHMASMNGLPGEERYERG